MKKVLIGILILIPIIILLVVALVTNLLQLQVWIAVEDMTVTQKATGLEAEELKLYLDVGDNTVYDLYDWVEVAVFPEKANNYTIEWSMSNLAYSDEEYQKQYEDYLENPVGTPVHPAATMVDGNGRDADFNTSGKFKVYSYCSFNVSVRAETVTRNFLVDIVGDTVHSVSLTDTHGSTSAEITVGESARLCASYVPFDSVITQLQFACSDESVLSVDDNGVITALSAGSATVTVTADKHDGTGTVESNAFFVTVREGASKFGNTVTLERVSGGAYTFEQLGIAAADVDAAACTGCTVQSDGIVVNGESAVVALIGGKTLTVKFCDAGDIAIGFASLFDSESGYILGVGEEKGLSLSAVFAATSATSAPEGVAWQSNNTEVATVDENGLVKGVFEGEVIITATAGGKKASITLNVKEKATSLRLKTSNDSLEVGLARQTVFPSDIYVYETDLEGGENKNQKQANSVTIHIHGEPESKSAAEIAAFYGRYIIEIEEGKEYAHMDPSAPNKIVFDGEALKGKGVVPVKVKASAKYPRFEANQKHTTDYVTLSVVYGVEVRNAEQLVRATADQKEYIMRSENLKTPAENEATIPAPDGNEYYVYNSPTFNSNYAMVLVSDIACPDGQNVSFDEGSGWCVRLYGDLYGNGHTVLAKPAQVVDSHSYLVHVAASNVTISNVTVRHEDRQITTLTGKTFVNSYCLTFNSRKDEFFGGRLLNERVEYCILENTYGAIDIQNSDVAVDGCIFRNISSVGMYGYCRVIDDTRYIYFNRINLNNTIFSSIIGPSMSLSFEYYALTSDGKYGRFSATGDKEESYRWVEENLVPRRYVHCIDQTGFLDIYNWQNAAQVTLVNTQDTTMDQLIATLSGPIIEQHPQFAPGVVRSGDLSYFHLGFMTSGIVLSGDKKVFDERTFLQLSLEDDRFFSVNTRTLSGDVPEMDQSYCGLIKSILNKLEVTMYAYKKDSSLTPTSTYTIDSKLINHLHEGK